MSTALNATSRPTQVLRRIVPVALACTGVMTLGGCGYSSWVEPHQETRALIVDHVAGAALDIGSVNGKIEAIATDRPDVSIEVTLRSPSLDRLSEARVVTHRAADDTLHISVEWPGGKRQNNEGASISINVPDAHDIQAQSSNGSITIAGLSGHAELKTTNGSVRVDTHDGSVYASTSNGRLSAEQVSGSVEMYSSNGSISIGDTFGPVRAESSNGNAVVTTMPGNVGPIRVRTSNGSITLNLGVGLDGILKCDTSNGKVTVTDVAGATLIQSSNRSVEMRLGDSDEISALRTSNGSVRVQGR
jgi:hypothetical protein